MSQKNIDLPDSISFSIETVSIQSIVIFFLVVASICIAQTGSISAATEGHVQGNSVITTVRKDD